MASMALPVVQSLHECTDFNKIIAPYVPQLNSLPQQFFQSISNPNSLNRIYLDTNPAITAFAFSLFLVPVLLLISEVNKNYSQVDRCWSIIPTVYNAHYAIYAHAMGLPTGRMDALAIVSVIWSVRLTFNYYRKGGYSIGSEDYRWAVLRKYINPPLFFVFNVLFISLAQSLLLFAITSPSYILLLTTRLPPTAGSDSHALTTADLVFSVSIVVLILLTFVADQQQWSYQVAKATYRRTAKPVVPYTQTSLDRGFVTTGLWAWSRHPNFAAEQMIWVSLYLWSCAVTKCSWNWSGVGALGYLCLFQASTWFTELISREKYPEYEEYQAKVGKFLPRFWTATVEDANVDSTTANGSGNGKRITRSKGKGR